MPCEHKNFRAHVSVNRLEDLGGFIADVRVECAECGLPFSFLGVSAGLSFERPTVSVDGCELHAPLEPGFDTDRGLRVSAVREAWAVERKLMQDASNFDVPDPPFTGSSTRTRHASHQGSKAASKRVEDDDDLLEGL